MKYMVSVVIFFVVVDAVVVIVIVTDVDIDALIALVLFNFAPCLDHGELTPPPYKLKTNTPGSTYRLGNCLGIMNDCDQ